MAGEAAGIVYKRVLTMDDMVRSNEEFFPATGVTAGDFLRAVRYTSTGAVTQSIAMRGQSGTVRNDRGQSQLLRN